MESENKLNLSKKNRMAEAGKGGVDGESIDKRAQSSNQTRGVSVSNQFFFQLGL